MKKNANTEQVSSEQRNCDSTLCPDSQSFTTYLMEQCQNRDIPLETEQLLQYATSTYSIFSRIESFLELLSYLREGLGRNAREKKRRDKGTHSMQEAPSGKHGGPTLPPSPAPHKAPPKPYNGNGEYQLAPNPNPAAADTKIASTTITITIFRTLPRSRSRSRKCTLNSANTHVCKPFPSLWKPKPKTQSNCQQSHQTPTQLREIMTFTARR